MTSLHVERKMRSGEGSEDAVQVEEKTPLPRWGQEPTSTSSGSRPASGRASPKSPAGARYAYDVRLPGQLYAAGPASAPPPRPHPAHRHLAGRARSGRPRRPQLDQRAEISPGTKTASSSRPRVRFVGEEVAAVAAESEDIAEDALRLIEVEYEPLPFVVDSRRP